MEKVVIYSYIFTIALFAYPAWKLFSTYLKYFVRYMFCVPNHWWHPEVERPRLLFILIGIIFLGLSLMFKYQEDALIYRLMSYFSIVVGIFTLYFVWSKKFEKRFIGRIKARLLGNSVKSIYFKGHDLEAVLQDFKFLNCTAETFGDFLAGNKVASDKKILCSLDKRKLIRFIFITFGFKGDVPNDTMKRIISHYFLEEKTGGKPYNIQEKVSEISDIRAEMI